MKLNRLETHDRYEHFIKQSFDIGECCQDLINQRPFGDHAFYIFAHTRTEEDGVTKRLIWQPRLTKPKPETNSMCFKAYPMSDNIKIMWIIPARELWDSFGKDKMTQSKTVLQSIDDFQFHRDVLERKEYDDLDDESINAIYRELSLEARRKKHMQKLYELPDYFIPDHFKPVT